MPSHKSMRQDGNESMNRNLTLLFLGLLPCLNSLSAMDEKTVLVHYMPWFSAKPEQELGLLTWITATRILFMGRQARNRFP